MASSANLHAAICFRRVLERVADSGSDINPGGIEVCLIGIICESFPGEPRVSHGRRAFRAISTGSKQLDYLLDDLLDQRHGLIGARYTWDS